MTKFHYFIYSILISLNLVLLIANSSYSIKYDVLEKKIEAVRYSSITSVFSVNDTLVNYEVKSLEYAESKKKVSDIVESGNKLVLYFTDDICESCLLSLLKTLNKKEFSPIVDNVIIMASFDRYNSFKLFMSNYEYKIKAYCVENKLIKLSKVDIGTPCFFILDKNLKIEHLLFHNKNDELLTELYIKNIMNLKLLDHR